MKKHFYLITLFLFLAVTSQSVSGQSAEQERQAHEQKTQEMIRKANIEIITGKPYKDPNKPNDSPTIPDDAAKSAARRKEIEERRKADAEYLAQLNILRTPNPDDLNKYQNFLRQKNTGLFKLFPNPGCLSKGVIRVDGDCANAVNNSYYYSFQRQNYYGSDYHDIRLDGGKIWLDGFLSQGIITDVGDIALENVSLRSDYAKFLVDFKPEKKSDGAKKQFWQISQKVSSNGFNFGKVVKPTVNTTYLARFIAYRLDKSHKPIYLNRETLTRETMPFLGTINDKKRIDSVVAFRVVRIDDDNSVTILWRQLAENKSPELKFAKGEKWTDLKVK